MLLLSKEASQVSKLFIMISTLACLIYNITNITKHLWIYRRPNLFIHFIVAKVDIFVKTKSGFLVVVLCSMRSILRNHRFRRDARTLEDEEEMWFNTDEDDLEDGEAVVPPSDKMKSEEDLMEPISKFMERKKC